MWMYCYFAVISALFWTTPTVFSNATLTRNLTELRNLALRSLVTIAVQRRAVDPSIVKTKANGFIESKGHRLKCLFFCSALQKRITTVRNIVVHGSNNQNDSKV